MGARVYGVGARVYGDGARVYGVGARVYGSLVIMESAQGPNPFIFCTFLSEHSLRCLKVVGGWVVAHVILVSAQGQNPSFILFIRILFDLGACWDQDLDQGLTIYHLT